jgi:hypothetical protein
MSFRFAEILLLALAVVGTLSRDPFKTLVAYETKQRVSAEVDDTQYHLLPFRITTEAQHFLQMPKTDELMRAEIVVHWVESSSSLHFPAFNLAEKVRVTI